MFLKYVKPISQKMLKQIKKADDERYREWNRTRYYSYLTIIKKEICKITVAVKNYKNQWLCKQVAVHYVPSNICYTKDMDFTYIAGYTTDWSIEDKDNKWWAIEDKYFNPYAPTVNLEIIDKIEKYKYSAYNLYDGDDIIKYLRTYEKYPETEKLLKVGLNQLVDYTSILQLVRKDRKFIKWLVKNKTTIQKIWKCDIPVIIKAYKTNQDIEKVQELRNFEKHLKGLSNAKDIKAIWKEKLNNLQEYLTTQDTSLYNYNDYIKACTYIGLDMTQSKNYKPKDFRTWHDIRTKEYATKIAEEDRKKKAKMYEDFKLVASKYLQLSYDKCKDYICIIAQSPKDLIYEGEMLHHCVGRMGYDQKFIKEESLIFFVRKKNEPNTPYVTIEFGLKSKSIKQCYAKHNSRPNESILKYINEKWLPYAKKQLNKISA